MCKPHNWQNSPTPCPLRQVPIVNMHLRSRPSHRGPANLCSPMCFFSFLQTTPVIHEVVVVYWRNYTHILCRHTAYCFIVGSLARWAARRRRHTRPQCSSTTSIGCRTRVWPPKPMCTRPTTCNYIIYALNADPEWLITIALHWPHVVKWWRCIYADIGVHIL